MKKIEILFLFLVINLLGLTAQTRQDSILNSLMQKGNWFEVRDYLSQNNDSISEMYYLATISLLDTYFNKPDSALMNTGILLNKYPKELDGATFSYGVLMMKTFVETQRYDEAIGLINDILTQTGNTLPKPYIDSFNSWLSMCDLYKNHPLKVVFDETEQSDADFTLPIAGIGLEGKVNGVKGKILLDTGTSLSRISKEVADQIGIHTYLTDTVLTNPTVKVFKGIIDSLEIGNVKIYNCPVDITLDRPDIPLSHEIKEEFFAHIDSLFDNYNNIIVGISTLKLTGIINFDFLKKKISFEQTATEYRQPSNMFIIDNTLYLYATLNNQPFTSMFDTGYSVGTFLNKDYYDKNKGCFSLIDEKEYEINTYTQDRLDTLVYKKLNNVTLKSYNNNFTLPNAMVNMSKPIEYSIGYLVPDGIIGNDFLKELQSLKLDFKNMCITFE